MVSKNIKIPEGWESTKLNCVADIIMGQSPSSQFVSENEIGIPFLQGNAEFTVKHPQEKLWVTKPKKMSQVNDVLISVRAPVGEINMAHKDFCIGRGLSAIRFNKILKEYGWYLIYFCKNQLNQVAQGSTFLAVSKNDVEELSLFFPISKAEQSKIAEILSTVDEAIDKTEALIQKYQRIKQGLMQDLLTKGMDEKGNIRSEKTHKFKDSPFGRIPEEWEVDYGSNIFKLGSGTTIKDGYLSLDGNCLYLKVDDLNSDLNTNGIVKAQSSFNNLDIKSAKIYKNGSIIFAKRGAAILLNRVMMLKNMATLDPNLMALMVFDNMDNYFFKYYLLFLNLANICDNSGIPQLNNKHLYPRLFIKPSKPEQSRIASILSQADETIQKEQIYKQKLLSLKRGLMEDLLAGKVRVNHLLN